MSLKIYTLLNLWPPTYRLHRPTANLKRLVLCWIIWYSTQWKLVENSKTKIIWDNISECGTKRVSLVTLQLNSEWFLKKMSGWSARRVGFVRGICLLCRLLCIIIAQADASQDHCEKNKSHLLKEIFLICHVQGQDVPKNINFQNTAIDQKS